MKHLIVDVETLGIHEDSVVLQVTAAMYDPDRKGELFDKVEIKNWKLNAKLQARSRKVDKDTLKFWEEQPKEVQKAALIPHSDDVEPEVFCDEMADWIRSFKYEKKSDMFWQRGTKDSDWLTSLFMMNGWEFGQMPWSWGRIRDIRTCVDVLGMSTKLNGYPDNIDELRDMVPNYRRHDSESDVKLELLILYQAGILGD